MRVRILHTISRYWIYDYWLDMLSVMNAEALVRLLIVLDPKHELTEFNSYRSYLESIDIRSDSGVRYANCPQH